MYRREATIRYFRAQGCLLHEAEDLTQEVQVRLYLARLRGVSITPGYWHSTCRSVLNDYLRHLRQQRQWLVSLEGVPTIPPLPTRMITILFWRRVCRCYASSSGRSCGFT
jgi:DNA-directed RNA polymerase specialized sigma24 family protein